MIYTLMNIYFIKTFSDVKKLKKTYSNLEFESSSYS